MICLFVLFNINDGFNRPFFLSEISDFLFNRDIITDIKIGLESTWCQIGKKINAITHR